MKAVRLSRWEFNIYLLLSIVIHAYSFYEVYRTSQEHEEELESEFDLETDSYFWGFKKDSTDFEWNFWMEWARWPLIWLMLGHVVVSQFARIYFKEYRPFFLMLYGMAACWFVLGTNGLAMILLNIYISYQAAKLKTPLITWISSMFMLFIMHNQSVENIQRSWYSSENEYYLLVFTLTVRCLYYTSFSLEYCTHQQSERESYTFSSMLVYAFYYPVFHNGPVITYNEFTKQLQNKDTSWPGPNILRLILDIFRLLLWWWLAESMLHLMYMHAMFSSYQLLERVSYWTLGGLALAQVLFFYVKYLVLYGAPALVMLSDGLNPPALPRCVSSMYSFSGIWRAFDVGLHRFLIRYIYIPLGGSHRGLRGMLLSTSCTFIFVCFWHGGHEYLWYWAALNWIGIITEQGVKKLLTASGVQTRINQCLSPRLFRQLHAALASVSTALLIFTNLIFLGGEHVGRIYWKRLFVQGWPWVPLTVFGCLFCFSQIGIEWNTFHFPNYKWGFPTCSRTKVP
ncbi:protein-cysteine N-palmitoyltransferase HHAT [Spea bombifrons]|uniref:protein-cysteine N-palmitoyltransferase HHAT n=1 Tax=Spea bombifrons TaxID=233779 RepID=UPI00234A333E|nr:protein-cysteine N-palmitoyltransferase HHAT [Spea bombifrons]